ncbi:Pilus assembly protein PilW [Paramixta manurensis]|uniref:Pilus assembly protein PilW n=1 Tax=Paramixta manurensis TaxID=2740817 RepID=A0A6M8UMS7_9GAMM|nr:Pilus assembly protein PilW [Erwiniaceae bacterium PD-1]
MRNGLRYSLLAGFVVSGCVSQVSDHPALQARLQLGLIYLAQGQLHAAQRNLQRAQVLAPEDYRTHLAMARLYQAQGRNDAAAQGYRLALQRAPHNGYVLNNYGAFLCGLGQYDAAQQQFRLAGRQLQPGVRADSLENTGYCYLTKGEQEPARQALSQAIKVDRHKGMTMLTEAERRFGNGEPVLARFLLDVYQHSLPATAESVWLEIRFAALGGRTDDVKRHGERLARNFPQSIQYQHFLANEY